MGRIIETAALRSITGWARNRNRGPFPAIDTGLLDRGPSCECGFSDVSPINRPDCSLPRRGAIIRRTLHLAAALQGLTCPVYAELDADNNQLSDVWQRKHGVGNLSSAADSDGDGFTNGQECLFGTHPLRADSRPGFVFAMPLPDSASATWPGEPGKRYEVQHSATLSQWLNHETLTGSGKPIVSNVPTDPGIPMFLRIAVSDIDSDGDGLNDWEELVSGFNPARVFSEGLGSNPSNPTVSNPRITDKERLGSAIISATNTITVAAADPSMSEDWPDPGRFVIRRSGNLDEITVDFSLGGTATPVTDYTSPPAFVKIPFGKDESEVSVTSLSDSESESPETITLTLLPGTGYTLGATHIATLNLADSVPGKPSAKPAARFLTQCTFGPTEDELDRVRNLGYSAWIEEQFLRPVNLHLPIVQTWQAELAPGTNSEGISSEHRMEAWWRQTMRDDSASDPLRQRMAFALSQIFVISDRMQSLDNDQRGMTGYYDTLLTHAFGNYRELLEAVTRHPWMGLYLSALKNRKADPSKNRFPDENYAREVMQLFSIGLWLLNPDGTQVLSDGDDLGPDGETIPPGQPIPTYGQSQISEIARVFTGMSYGMRFVSGTDPTEIPTNSFSNNSQNIPWHPMRMFDGEHDIAAKTISLPGMPVLQLPARTGTTSTSPNGGDADLTAFLDHLTAHPSTAPFVCRLLIQRLVASNPTPEYLGRVSSAFTTSGGDMKAVVRAILLDGEARDYSRLSDSAHGLVREPYTRYVTMARAFDAAPADASAGGRYRGFGSLDSDFLQRPLSAPSVFNFYSPDNKPPGPLRDSGLASPEMQITNSVSSITGPNRYSTALSITDTSPDTGTPPSNVGWTQINQSRQNDDSTTTDVNEATWNTRIDEQAWLDLATSDPAALAPDAMVARLDQLLCYGNMGQPTFRSITRALDRLSDPFASGITTTVRDERIRARLRNAIHLVTTSADYAVLK